MRRLVRGVRTFGTDRPRNAFRFLIRPRESLSSLFTRLLVLSMTASTSNGPRTQTRRTLLALRGPSGSRLTVLRDVTRTLGACLWCIGGAPRDTYGDTRLFERFYLLFRISVKGQSFAIPVPTSTLLLISHDSSGKTLQSPLLQLTRSGGRLAIIEFILFPGFTLGGDGIGECPVERRAVAE